MSLPTERQIRDLFTTLRAFATPTGKPPTSRLDDLEHRLLRALIRDRTGTNTIDGYSANTSSDGRGGSELTSVESAANRTTFGKVELDKIHEHTFHAVTFLYEAAGNLGALAHRLDAIDELSAPTPKADTAGTGYCQACGTHCSGAGDDRLRSGYCNPCRMAWDRAGRPDRASFERERRARTVPSP